MSTVLMYYQVVEVELNTLLSDVFYGKNTYGHIYRVTIQDEEQKKNPTRDFYKSVDRNYMALRHNSQFIGIHTSSLPKSVLLFALFLCRTNQVGTDFTRKDFAFVAEVPSESKKNYWDNCPDVDQILSHASRSFRNNSERINHHFLIVFKPKQHELLN